MKAKNKTANWKINWRTEEPILNDVESLLNIVTATEADNVTYTYRIKQTGLNNHYTVTLSLDFKELNFHNFFKKVNFITSKIATLLLTSHSYIEETWTNNL